MSAQSDYRRTIESEVRVPFATTQLVQLHADVPTDLVMFDRET